METQAKRYRMHADECERLARTALREADRSAFLHMAQQWRALAKRADAGATGHPIDDSMLDLIDGKLLPGD